MNKSAEVEISPVRRFLRHKLWNACTKKMPGARISLRGGEQTKLFQTKYAGVILVFDLLDAGQIDAADVPEILGQIAVSNLPNGDNYTTHPDGGWSFVRLKPAEPSVVKAPSALECSTAMIG